MMELSKRLSAVASMVTEGNRAADIGCDHGYVSIWLVENGICPHVIAMDVNRGPLERAQGNIREHDLSDYIETRLSDGLEALCPGEADTMIAAGIGGRLAVRILSDHIETVHSLQELVLQPQSEIAMVRRFLREQGYTVVKEEMVLEDGKFYPVLLAAVHAKKQKSVVKEELADRFGGFLLQQKDPVLLQFLKKEEKVCQKLTEELKASGAGTKKTGSRLQEIGQELGLIQEALAICQEDKHALQ